MPSTKNTLSADQQKLMEIISQASAALAALSASSVTKKVTSKPKSTTSAPAEKKPLNPKIAAMNEERMAIFEEMKSAWFATNPSAEGLEPKELKERIKKGDFPALPTYPEALKEHSKRMGEADPEHAAKSQARRDALDAKQAEKKKEKKVFKVKTEKPEPKVSTIYETEDAEEFNMELEIDGQKLLLNGENWVLSKEDQSWVGLWNPETKMLDRTAPAPSD